MLEVMIFLIDQFHAFLCHAVILSLHVQKALEVLPLHVHPQFAQRHMVGHQDRHASKVHAGADDEDFCGKAAGKRRVL